MTSVTKGYKFRIYPNPEQIDLLERSFGCTRFVWNRLLAQAKKEYEEHKTESTLPKPGVSGYDFVKKLPKLKEEFEFLSEISYIILQQKALDLGSAFSRFFEGLKKAKTNYPQFKKKRSRQSVRFVGNAYRMKSGCFYIAKCKSPVKIKLDRPLPSEPTSCTISKTPSGEYYVSFICKADPVLTNGGGQIGIDFGLKDLLTISDGTKIPNPKHFVNQQRRLARAQRAHARKQIGSKNREKSRIRIAKIHRDISNLRSDFLHKLSRTLVNENQVIGVENLNVVGMSRNHCLSKHILDSGWSTFIRYLCYKATESNWCTIVFMDRFYPSSHLCSETDLKLDRKLDLKERQWFCPHCHSIHDRDLNASLNMKHRALECIAEYGISPGSVVQDKWSNREGFPESTPVERL